MSTETHTYKRQEVRRRFVEEGVSITDWAAAHGFRRESVYAVLRGRCKGKRGEGHRIAVALRLKAPRAESWISVIGRDPGKEAMAGR